jgi:hypothetical protein
MAGNATDDHGGGDVTVTVNTKPVTLAAHRVTGLQVKEAAIAQGVEIQLDFLLTLEAHGGQPARTVDDDDTITVTKHSEFSANDGDDDS